MQEEQRRSHIVQTSLITGMMQERPPCQGGAVPRQACAAAAASFNALTPTFPRPHVCRSCSSTQLHHPWLSSQLQHHAHLKDTAHCSTAAAVARVSNSTPGCGLAHPMLCQSIGCLVTMQAASLLDRSKWPCFALPGNTYCVMQTCEMHVIAHHM